MNNKTRIMNDHICTRSSKIIIKLPLIRTLNLANGQKRVDQTCSKRTKENPRKNHNTEKLGKRKKGTLPSSNTLEDFFSSLNKLLLKFNLLKSFSFAFRATLRGFTI